ncbi:MAG: helix-turn-helix domain-containing protein [Spirochaetota bacterium]
MKDMNTIQNLVGPVTEEMLRYIDYAVAPGFGVFSPAVGPCFYSLSEHHTHPSYMVVFNLNEAGTIMLQDKKIRTEANTVYYFSPGVVHHEVIEDDFVRYYVFLIEQAFFERQLALFTDTIPRLEGADASPDPNLIHYTHDFICEYESDNAHTKEQLSLLAQRISYILSRSLHSGSRTAMERFNVYSVDRAISMIHQKFTGELSIQDIADSVHLSASHFSRIFKKVTGMSVPDYLKKVRLEKARRLLSRTSLSITEIAFSCGFNSSSYFTTSFTGHFGTNPSQYRDSFFPHVRQNL